MQQEPSRNYSNNPTIIQTAATNTSSLLEWQPKRVVPVSESEHRLLSKKVGYQQYHHVVSPNQTVVPESAAFEVMSIEARVVTRVSRSKETAKSAIDPEV